MSFGWWEKLVIKLVFDYTLRTTIKQVIKAMRKRIVSLLSITVCLLSVAKIAAQEFSVTDSMTRKKITLIFINKDSLLNPDTKEKMIDAFYKVYPAEMKRFNHDAPKRVTFIIDPGYKGVAATGGGVVRVNPTWMRDHPEDIDVVTHEVMHLVQSYGRGGGPGWLTEGIADYVRYKFGVNNIAGKWVMPDYKAGQSYTNAYRITARFLVWIEQQGHKKIVDKLDAASRSHTYTPELWKEITGKTVDELWADYAQNPVVKLSYH